MKRKAILLCIMFIFFCSGCGAKTEKMQFSFLDVYGYTGNSIIFKVIHDDYDAFYELSFNMADSINFAFGTSLDAMDDIIVCD